jgi:hypothetical protein
MDFRKLNDERFNRAATVRERFLISTTTVRERVVISTATVRERPADRHAPTPVAVSERNRNDLTHPQIKRTR